MDSEQVPLTTDTNSSRFCFIETTPVLTWRQMSGLAMKSEQSSRARGSNSERSGYEANVLPHNQGQDIFLSYYM